MGSRRASAASVGVKLKRSLRRLGAEAKVVMELKRMAEE